MTHVHPINERSDLPCNVRPTSESPADQDRDARGLDLDAPDSAAYIRPWKSDGIAASSRVANRYFYISFMMLPIVMAPGFTEAGLVAIPSIIITVLYTMFTGVGSAAALRVAPPIMRSSQEELNALLAFIGGILSLVVLIEATAVLLSNWIDFWPTEVWLLLSGPALAFVSVFIAVCVFARSGHRLLPFGCCTTCGYDLNHIDSTTCPECGTSEADEREPTSPPHGVVERHAAANANDVHPGETRHVTEPSAKPPRALRSDGKHASPWIASGCCFLGIYLPLVVIVIIESGRYGTIVAIELLFSVGLAGVPAFGAMVALRMSPPITAAVQGALYGRSFVIGFCVFALTAIAFLSGSASGLMQLMPFALDPIIFGIAFGFVVGFMMMFISMRAYIRDDRRAYPEGCCIYCGYDLSHIDSDICPECGHTMVKSGDNDPETSHHESTSSIASVAATHPTGKW